MKAKMRSNVSWIGGEGAAIGLLLGLLLAFYPIRATYDSYQSILSEYNNNLNEYITKTRGYSKQMENFKNKVEQVTLDRERKLVRYSAAIKRAIRETGYILRQRNVLYEYIDADPLAELVAV